MSKPRLLITRELPASNLHVLRTEFDVVLHTEDRRLTASEANAVLHDFDAILPTLGDEFTADAFQTGPFRTRILANFGVGYNHIDAEAARAAGIVVTNTPGAVTDATADIAMMLILMACRRASLGERMVRAGEWKGWKPTQLLGTHVSGKTLGIIGMGRIGQAIAQRGHFGFGMEVVFHNRSPKPDLPFPATHLPDLHTTLARADIVVISAPATAETHHLIDAAALKAMKPSGYLINIARGNLVDEAALISALQAEQIAGAGLDVYEFEPQVPEALIALDNVTLLPHLGTAALEVRENMGQMAIDNLQAFFAGDTPPNVV